MKKFTILKDDDYHQWGFKSGLEIHYQLKTDKKLFCRCPAVKRNDPPDATIKRHMRPTLSELGEYDGTALMEFKTRKNVLYQLYRDTVCTYEMDDTPPFPLNQQALDIALEFAMLLHCTVIDEIHITRKQYLDGSIPTGFQRTATIGVDGWIELYSGKKVGISHVCLEEDACREISDEGHNVVFRTDRLSFPLIEVITRAELLTPHEVAEAVERICAVLRATGKVRRGIGAARQDVNVSVTGSTRIEIKGVPRYPMIPHWVHSEAVRQRNLLKLRDELRARGITKDNLKVKAKGLNHVFAKTQVPVLRQALDAGQDVRGICLYGFGGLFCREVQPDVFFEREFEGRVRVIACLDRRPILLHTDDASRFGFSEADLDGLRHQFNYKQTDVVLLVWGPEEDTKTAVEEIRIRAQEATQGVPSETRQALQDGTNDFERILPGPDRMYPDTDSPAVQVAPQRLRAIAVQMPEDPLDIEKRYRRHPIPAQWARILSKSPLRPLFEDLIAEGADPRAAGRLCVMELPSFRLNGQSAPFCNELLKALREKTLVWSEVREALKKLKEDPHARPSIPPALDDQARAAVRQIMNEKIGLKPENLIVELQTRLERKVSGWRVIQLMKEA